MSRKKKTAKHTDLKPWLSANTDNHDGRFIQVGNSLLLSKEFHKLGAGARYLYLCMSMESGGSRTFEFPHRSAKKYGIPVSSFERQTKELISNGFIEQIETNEREQFRPNKYMFIFTWKGLTSAPHFGESKK